MKLNESLEINSSQDAIELVRGALRFDNMTALENWSLVFHRLRSQIIAREMKFTYAYEVSPKAELLTEFWDAWPWYRTLPIEAEDYLDVIERSRVVFKEILDGDATQLGELVTFTPFIEFARQRFDELCHSEKYRALMEGIDPNAS